jgi:diguanylate cyclase (GGDEF)-like protein/PAS domain S-box-containing protein
MKRFHSSLITKIALLVVCVEMVAFGVLGWFYIDRFSTAADEQVRSRLQLVQQLIAQNELQINAFSRAALMGDLLGAEYKQGMIIGGNGRVIVATDPAQLGRSIGRIDGFDPRLLADSAPELQYLPGADELTCIMRISDAQGRPLYHGVITIDTTAINAERRAIVLWGWAASLAFILLSSVGILLVVHRFFSRRVEQTLEVLKQVEGGALELRIPVSSRDEMGQLQLGINSMIGHIGTLLSRHRRNEEELDAILNAISEGLIAIDREGRIVRINAHAREFLGTAPATVGRNLREYLPQLATQQKPACEAALLEGKSSAGLQFELADPAGGARSIELSCGPVRDSDHAITGAVLVLRDITERKAAEEQQRLAASVFTAAREGIVITDAEGTIVDVNNAFTQITGYPPEEVVGENPRILKSDRHANDFYVAMWRSLLDEGYWVGEVWNRRKNGEIYPELLTISAVKDAAGEPKNYVGLFFDITTQKEQQRQLEYVAHNDALTHLPNRVLLADRLHQAMLQATRRKQLVAVVYLDLDGFKEVNDKFGHTVGDQLLVSIAQRMKSAMRQEDTIARLGGDEFVAVFTDLADATAVQPLLKRLLAAVAQPVQVGEVTLQISASLGVTFYPQAEEVDADQLLRQADQAMYQAKLSGKNRYHLFDAEQDRTLRGYHESLENIRRAMNENELVLYYQPQVNMRSGEVVGVEALVRWNHPERGLVSPAVFLPVIEDHDLAIELGEWVLDSALSQLAIWRAAGLAISVSVNVGARQLQEANFVERLRELLAAHPTLGPGDLKLEVLETSALNDIDHVSRVIAACESIGINFALDDFGTGYSSLTYLKRLPATQLKIDTSFVRDMLDDPEDLAILEGVLSLATAFRRNVIAEGVELRAQGELLLQLGCELAQGYGIARPMPADEILDWAATWKPAASWANQKRVSRDDLPLLFAGVEHSAWVRKIEEFIGGERLLRPQLDHHQCRFGHWLDSDGHTRYSTAPGYAEVEKLHRQAHALATELLEDQARGRHAQARAKLGELHEMKERLLAQLLSLREENLR